MKQDFLLTLLGPLYTPGTQMEASTRLGYFFKGIKNNIYPLTICLHMLIKLKTYYLSYSLQHFILEFHNLAV